MIKTGFIVGIIWTLAFLGIMFKFPLKAKYLMVKYAIITDVIVSWLAYVVAGGVTGFISSGFTGLFMSVVLVVLHKTWLPSLEKQIKERKNARKNAKSHK